MIIGNWNVYLFVTGTNTSYSAKTCYPHQMSPMRSTKQHSSKPLLHIILTKQPAGDCLKTAVYRNNSAKQPRVLVWHLLCSPRQLWSCLVLRSGLCCSLRCFCRSVWARRLASSKECCAPCLILIFSKGYGKSMLQVGYRDCHFVNSKSCNRLFKLQRLFACSASLWGWYSAPVLESTG